MRRSRSLFIYLVAIFVCSLSAILLFQHGQEKSIRKTYLNATLTKYNKIIDQFLTENSVAELPQFLALMPEKELRLWVTDKASKVLFENFSEAGINASYQAVRGAQLHSTVGEIYICATTSFPNFSVTSALPYNLTFESSVSENSLFLIFVGVLLLVVILLIYFLSKHYSESIVRDEARLKRQLTQNISHELKTPVSSILGYTETLLSATMSDVQRTTFLERSYLQAKRLKQLLEDLTEVNKLDDARELYEKTHCDLRAVVDEVLQDLKLQIEEKSCVVHLSLPAEIPIFGNRSLLYSVFRNLLENALTYAGAAPEVSIVLRENDKRYYRFTFSDSGQGVAAEHLSRLFDRFYRVDKGRSRKSGGTGLGLSIVKNAILFHNGNIRALNAPTGGLCFEFSLKKY